MTTPPVDRPNPLKDAAQKVGTAWSAVAGVVGALVSFGVLSSVQGDAVTAAGQAAEGTVTALGTVMAGVLPLIAGIVSAFTTTSSAKSKVTPTEDPRDNAGRPLVPAAPAAPTRLADPQQGGVVSDGGTWTS